MHVMWRKLLEQHLRRKLESDMEKWKTADLANLKCKDRNQYNSCLIVSVAGYYVPLMLIQSSRII